MPRNPSKPGHAREVRPGVWEVSVQHGLRRDGSPRVAYRTVHGTEADADRERDRLAAEIGVVRTLGDRLTLDDYF